MWTGNVFYWYKEYIAFLWPHRIMWTNKVLSAFLSSEDTLQKRLSKYFRKPTLFTSIITSCQSLDFLHHLHFLECDPISKKMNEFFFSTSPVFAPSFIQICHLAHVACHIHTWLVLPDDLEKFRNDTPTSVFHVVPSHGIIEVCN